MVLNSFDIFEQIEKAPFEPGFLPSGEPVIDRRHKRVIDAVNPHGHILEVGPGIGKLAVYFNSIGRPYSMVDIDRSKLFSYYEHIGTMLATPSYIFKETWEWGILPDDCYCSVIASEVIEHVSNYRGLIEQMIRVSRGNVILTTP
jgi:2-polyprenyl-3-methyl-5-hydroxy-6-metoxy-1,4-benzoquinol methylase